MPFLLPRRRFTKKKRFLPLAREQTCARSTVEHAVPRRERGHGVEPETRGERLKLALHHRQNVVAASSGVPGDPVLPRRRKRVFVFVFVIVSRIAGRRIDRVLEDGAPEYAANRNGPASVPSPAGGSRRRIAPATALRALLNGTKPRSSRRSLTHAKSASAIYTSPRTSRYPGIFATASSESRRSSPPDDASTSSLVADAPRELVGDVLALEPVPAGHALFHDAADVRHGNRRAVNLRISATNAIAVSSKAAERVAKAPKKTPPSPPQRAPAPPSARLTFPLPRARRFVREHVGQRAHGHDVRRASQRGKTRRAFARRAEELSSAEAPPRPRRF